MRLFRWILKLSVTLQILISDAADRFVLSELARFFDCCSTLVIVKPATLIGWHRSSEAEHERDERDQTGGNGDPVPPLETAF